MDGNKQEIIKEKSTNEETNLPEVTASLELLTVTSNVSPKVGTKRILRKRIPKPDTAVTANRRCSQKPRKRGHSEMESGADIREYYLDKNLKLSPKKLETILEERKDTSESNVYIGAKKFKRMIEFQVQPTASKLRKRKARVKKVFGVNVSHRRKCTTMQALFDKLNSVQPDSSPEFQTGDKDLTESDYVSPKLFLECISVKNE